jgi:hypothetical protein
MADVMHLYVDDSGTRNPDKAPGRMPAHGYDWFSLGGVLIRREDEDAARELHSDFMNRWNLDPDKIFLHSSDIRNKTEDFTWLAGLDKLEHARFLNDLYELMRKPPFIGFACVIDRPGYNERYLEKYGRQRWALCKTAFAVVVERAAKYAMEKGCKLKVFVERGDKTTDGVIKNYYKCLRQDGMPFNTTGMEKYAPLKKEELHSVLYDFNTKNKSSPIMQIADLYLWPMSIGGYHRSNKSYERLLNDGKLIDSQLNAEQLPHLGIKYSCWELVAVKP